MTINIGLVVNPIAGMGGSVGLKGTDGSRYAEAVARGAQPVAPDRAVRFLTGLDHTIVTVVVVAGQLGSDHCKAAGVQCRCLDRLVRPEASEAEADGGAPSPETGGAGTTPSGATTGPADTIAAVHRLIRSGIHLLVFVGGDGTARDVLQATEGRLPILGVPAGVKMFSAVFAATPEAAARAIAQFADEGQVAEAEILDVDEAAYAGGRLQTKLHGVAEVPVARQVVAVGKQVVPGPDESELKEAIADFVAEMADGRTAVLGPGSTVAAIKRRLCGEATLLGFDVVRRGELLVRDGSAASLEPHIDEDTLVVLSPIGAQGYFLGRGTQQLTPELLHRIDLDGLVIVATPTKLRATPVLRVDTGDPSLDCELRGYRRAVTGYRMLRMVRVQ